MGLEAEIWMALGLPAADEAELTPMPELEPGLPPEASVDVLMSDSKSVSAELRSVRDVTTLKLTAIDQPSLVHSVDEPVGEALWFGETLVFTTLRPTGVAYAAWAVVLEGRSFLSRRLLEVDSSEYLSLSRTTGGELARLTGSDRTRRRAWLVDPRCDAIHLAPTDEAGYWDVDCSERFEVWCLRTTGRAAWWLRDRGGSWVRANDVGCDDFQWFHLFGRELHIAPPLFADEALVIFDLQELHRNALTSAALASSLGGVAPVALRGVWPGRGGWLNMSISGLSFRDRTAGWRSDAGVKAPDFTLDAEVTTTVVWSETEDGQRVPISMAWSGNISSPRPALILSYGCYGQPFIPEYAPIREPLLKRGFVIAMVHARGGGELGLQWHQRGRGGYKENTVRDITSAVHYLRSEGFIDSRRTVLRSQSAGCAVVLAALHGTRDLVAGAVFDRPHIDLRNDSRTVSFLADFDLSEWGFEGVVVPAVGTWLPFDKRPVAPLPPILARVSPADGRTGSAELDAYSDRLKSWGVEDPVRTVLIEGQHSHAITDPRVFVRDVAQTFAWIIDVTASEGR